MDLKADITYVNSGLSARVKSLDSIASMTAQTGVADGQQFSVVEYTSGLGYGGGDFIAKSGSPSINNVTIFLSATPEI